MKRALWYTSLTLRGSVSVLLFTATSLLAQPSAVQRAADSVAARKQVYELIDNLEREAAKYRSPTATKCSGTTRTTGGSTCGIVSCTFEPGRAPCLLGRFLPCSGGGLYFYDATLDMCAGSSPGARADSARLFPRRAAALSSLIDIATRFPEDGWILGQVLWTLESIHDHGQASAVVEPCKASRAWCAALLGYANTRGGVLDGFSSRLARMLGEDGVLLCDFTDLGALLDPDTPDGDSLAFRRYREAQCGTPRRRAFEARYWWLADPSWLVAGNDRYAEHLARAVERTVWTAWVDEVCRQEAHRCGTPTFLAMRPPRLMRQGAPDSWISGLVTTGPMVSVPIYDPSGKRVAHAVGAPECATRSSMRVTSRYHFAPAYSQLTHPVSSPAGTWDLFSGPPVAYASAFTCQFHGPAPERHTPPYAGLVRALPDWQVAYFRRGDSAVLVAAADVRRDSVLRALPATITAAGDTREWSAGVMGFAHLPPDGLPRDSFRVSTAGAFRDVWRFASVAPWDSVLLGIELFHPPRVDASGRWEHAEHITAAETARGAAGVLARTRFGVAPPVNPRQRVGISDLLLYERTEAPVPRSLDGPDGAAARMMGTTRLGSRRELALFWEVYGVVPSDSVAVTLTVREVRVERGFLSRSVAALRGNRTSAIEIEWTEPFSDRPNSAIWPRTISANLSALRPGEYVASITLRVPSEAPVMAARTFTVERGR